MNNPTIDMKTLARDLTKLGLSENESLVYLASLELGPSPVQVIARKAEVNRATTYVMIEMLIKRGLMSTFEKGKKTMFTAEKPERLHKIVHQERQLVEEKEETVTRLLPDLESLLAASGTRPKVSFYEGEEGLEVIREAMFSSRLTELDDVVSFDDLRQHLPEEHWQKHGERLVARRVKGRVLYSADLDLKPNKGEEGLWEYKKIPNKAQSLHGELTVCGDRVAMIALKGKLVGVLIESKEMADMVRVIFELAWKQADPNKK
jgi:sugar-specific transcriptional regulator TrmB